MTGTMPRRPASANEKLRVEPTALPTRLCRTRVGLLGFHPLALTATA